MRAERACFARTPDDWVAGGPLGARLDVLLEQQIFLGPRAPHLHRLYDRFRLADRRRLARRVDAYALGITLFFLYLAGGMDARRRAGDPAAEAVRAVLAALCHPDAYDRPEVGPQVLRLFDAAGRELLSQKAEQTTTV